jgi:hypothetical protein
MAPSRRRISASAARPVRSTPRRASASAERLGKLVADHADLQDHHADGVGDDVVQLARDPRALLGDGDAGRTLPFPLGLRGAGLGGLGLHRPLA